MKRSEFLQSRVKEFMRSGRKGLEPQPIQYASLTIAAGGLNQAPPVPSKKKDFFPTGEVGIELEAEGRFRFTDNFQNGEDRFWTFAEEGSLRNGCEMILKAPIPEELIDEALDHLIKGTEGTTWNQSIRTSLHIHQNVLEWSLYDVYKALGAWWMFENILVRLNGAEREGNLFCLRVLDAEDLVEGVIDSLHSKATLWGFHPNAYRYAACNVAAVQKYGSLEYRFMRGYTDPEKIKMWAKGLLHFGRQTKQFATLQDIIHLLEQESIFDFLPRFLTPELYAEVMKNILMSDLHELLMINFCHTYRLAMEMDKDIFFKPSIMRDDDTRDTIDIELRQKLRQKAEYDLRYSPNEDEIDVEE